MLVLKVSPNDVDDMNTRDELRSIEHLFEESELKSAREKRFIYAVKHQRNKSDSISFSTKRSVQRLRFLLVVFF